VPLDVLGIASAALGHERRKLLVADRSEPERHG
jgi:hypothetical protein